MLRHVAIPIVILPLLAASLAPAMALPIEDGKMVTFVARKDKVQGYLVRPSKPDFYPGVVVIHEWWGLNDQIKGVAERLASAGYTAIVPDLYRGKVPTDAGLAHELMRGLNENWAVDVIDAAATYLRSPEVSPAQRPRGQVMPVATIGFCMGGRLSLATGLQGKGIQAVVMFYGSVETEKSALKPLKVPLLGMFGNEDQGIPVDQIKAFEAALKDAGKDATILIYPGAGHGYFNETRPSYDREAASDSWERTKMFLTDKLGGSVTRSPKGLVPPPPKPVPPKPDAPPSPGARS